MKTLAESIFNDLYVYPSFRNWGLDGDMGAGQSCKPGPAVAAVYRKFAGVR